MDICLAMMMTVFGGKVKRPVFLLSHSPLGSYLTWILLSRPLYLLEAWAWWWSSLLPSGFSHPSLQLPPGMVEVRLENGMEIVLATSVPDHQGQSLSLQGQRNRIRFRLPGFQHRLSLTSEWWEGEFLRGVPSPCLRLGHQSSEDQALHRAVYSKH